MSKYEHDLHMLKYNEIKKIREEANKIIGKYKINNRIIGDNIFNIIEMDNKVLYYPIEDDEICGFYSQIDGNNFVYINTHIPLEKQVFAAAHELYHLCTSDQKKEELLKSEMLEEGKMIEKIEAKANRFAAELLVPKDILINELDLRNIKKEDISLKNIIILMDIFFVPYKTIIRRLYEIEYITEEQCQRFLQIPDRNKNEHVMLWQKRLKLCERHNIRTDKVKLDNFLDLALRSYEKKVITYEKLKNLLSFINYKPEDFNIIKKEENLLTEDEFLSLMEDDE